MHAQHEERYNAQSRSLQQLHIGAEVRVQHPTTKRWDRVGVIIRIGQHRDYHVKPQAVDYIGAIADFSDLRTALHPMKMQPTTSPMTSTMTEHRRAGPSLPTDRAEAIADE